jgi:hypothetical protein
MTLRPLIMSALLIAALPLVAATTPRRAPSDFPEHLSGRAINVGIPERVRSGAVDIVIVRWASVAESAAIMTAFRAHGADGLLDILSDSPRVGYIRTPDSWSYALRFAWDEPTANGGRRIILATDHRLSLWDEMRRRELGYWFSLIEIHLGADGVGEGKMALTTRVRAVDGARSIDLAEYDNEAVRLEGVQVDPWFD